jgi:hypothetical protein
MKQGYCMCFGEIKPCKINFSIFLSIFFAKNYGILRSGGERKTSPVQHWILKTQGFRWSFSRP